MVLAGIEPAVGATQEAPPNKSAPEDKRRNASSSDNITIIRTGEWLAAELQLVQATLRTRDANIDISEELYAEILAILPTWRTIYPDHAAAAKAVAAQLYLWGRDYSNGRLSKVLSQADDVWEMVIDLLLQIGRLLYRDLSRCESSLNQDSITNIKCLLGDFELLLDRSSFILDEVRSVREEVPDRREKSQNVESPPVRCELTSGISNGKFEASNEGDSSIVLTESDGASISSSQDNDSLDLLEDLVMELLELLPALEQSCSHLQLPKESRRKEAHFSVSESALPFVQSIADKFKDADQRLVQRLGEANWQRFQTIRARMEHSEPVFKDEVPRSLFKPQTLFHDSGIGLSIASESLKPTSTASHTSFASTVSEGNQGKFHVPRTPASVSLGKDFQCEICFRVVSNVKNRIQWRMHVFQDLQPYVCTFPDCNEQLTTFAIREQWANHEFSKHRVIHNWPCPECHEAAPTACELEEHLLGDHRGSIKREQVQALVEAAKCTRPVPIEDQTCPLCFKMPGKSKRQFITHVGRHLESAALAVLPREMDDDSDANSDISNYSIKSKPTSSTMISQNVLEDLEPIVNRASDIEYEASKEENNYDQCTVLRPHLVGECSNHSNRYTTSPSSGPIMDPLFFSPQFQNHAAEDGRIHAQWENAMGQARMNGKFNEQNMVEEDNANDASSGHLSVAGGRNKVPKLDRTMSDIYQDELYNPEESTVPALIPRPYMEATSEKQLEFLKMWQGNLRQGLNQGVNQSQEDLQAGGAGSDGPNDASINLTPKQEAEMDGRTFPPAVIVNSAMTQFIPLGIKTWGELKKWAQSQSHSHGNMVSYLNQLQAMHWNLLQRPKVPKSFISSISDDETPSDEPAPENIATNDPHNSKSVQSTKGKKFWCQTCDSYFSRSELLDTHLRDAHTRDSRDPRDPRDPPYACSARLCTERFWQKEERGKHYILAHLNGYGYECAVCQVTFDQNAALEHVQNRGSMCYELMYASPREDDVEEVIEEHCRSPQENRGSRRVSGYRSVDPMKSEAYSEFPFLCPHKDCKRSNGKSYRRKDDLVSHLRRVHRGVGIETTSTAPSTTPKERNSSFHRLPGLSEQSQPFAHKLERLEGLDQLVREDAYDGLFGGVDPSNEPQVLLRGDNVRIEKLGRTDHNNENFIERPKNKSRPRASQFMNRIRTESWDKLKENKAAEAEHPEVEAEAQEERHRSRSRSRPRAAYDGPAMGSPGTAEIIEYGNAPVSTYEQAPSTSAFSTYQRKNLDQQENMKNKSTAPSPKPIVGKYRRHPELDKNAPKRPSSAYALFTDRVREEARPLKLNSGVVEKLVNSRWNSLSTSELEEYETQAAEAMELYNVELEKYKGTESYRDYQRYMAEYQESRKRHYEQQAATPPEPHVTSFIT